MSGKELWAPQAPCEVKKAVDLVGLWRCGRARRSQERTGNRMPPAQPTRMRRNCHQRRKCSGVWAEMEWRLQQRNGRNGFGIPCRADGGERSSQRVSDQDDFLMIAVLLYGTNAGHQQLID